MNFQDFKMFLKLFPKYDTLNDKIIRSFIENNEEEEIKTKLKKFNLYGCNDKNINEVFENTTTILSILGCEDLKIENQKIVKVTLLALKSMIYNDLYNCIDKYNEQNDEMARKFFNDAINYFDNELHKELNDNGDLANIVLSLIETKNSENATLLFEDFFEFCRKTKSSICFYPSSYLDQSDLTFFEEEINIFPRPNIFIHVDFWDINPYINGSEEYDIFHAEMSTILRDDSKVFLFKIVNKKNNSVKWLLHFTRTQNEEILIRLLSSKIKIDFLLSKCDGITSGMGHGIGISTILYIVFLEILQFKFIITEYGIDYWRNNANDYEEVLLNNFKDWIRINLYEDLYNSILERMADKNIEDLIKEYKIPIIDSNVLNNRGYHFF
jgi:hypothetical protein